MCGSGTLLIEGALIARRIAPGLMRSLDLSAFNAPPQQESHKAPGRRSDAPMAPGSWPFQRWPDYEAGQWEDAVDEARASIRPWNGLLLGNDIHQVRASRATAGAAGGL